MINSHLTDKGQVCLGIIRLHYYFYLSSSSLLFLSLQTPIIDPFGFSEREIRLDYLLILPPVHTFQSTSILQGSVLG